MLAFAPVTLLLAAGFVAAQESSIVETTTVVVPETTTTVLVPIVEETESVTLVPVDTTSWVRYWPEVESSTVITSTIYGTPNATGWEPPHPTAAAGRADVGCSLAAFVGFGIAGLLLL